MKHNSIVKLFLFAFIINIASPLFSEDLYVAEENKVSQGFQDLRRFEIITLGALPFVMLDTNLVYSGIKYIQNDFSSQYKPGFDQKFSPEEQKGLVLTSLGICVGIGLTDFIVNLVKRNKNNKKQEQSNSSIVITPISQDPNATKIDIPKEINNTKD